MNYETLITIENLNGMNGNINLHLNGINGNINLNLNGMNGNMNGMNGNMNGNMNGMNGNMNGNLNGMNGNMNGNLNGMNGNMNGNLNGMNGMNGINGISCDNSVILQGTNPIRSMVTSLYKDICSQYGLSNININPQEYYVGSNWCNVGIVTNSNERTPYNIMALEARFVMNEWFFRIREPITQLYFYINQGNGPYRCYRNNDTIKINGKDGDWIVQIQDNKNLYRLCI